MSRFNVKQFLLLISCGLLFSCANTVVQKETPDIEITFQITFGATPNFTAYNYYIVYGNSTNMNINYLLNQHYFFIPGESYDAQYGDQVTSTISGINYFYNTFFESWGGIIKLKSTDIAITSGPFSESSATNEADRVSEHLSYIAKNQSIDNYSLASTTLTFSIPESLLNLTTDTLFFTIVTTTGNDLNNINDMIPDLQQVQIIRNRPAFSGSNDASTFPRTISATNIESWTITVQ